MSSPLAKEFRKVLDSNGHALQVALASYLTEKRSEGSIHFTVDAQEVAVQAGDSVTHIDFVLRNWSRTVWLVCECKRSDPAISNWCFARMKTVEHVGPTDVLGEVGKVFNGTSFFTKGDVVGSHSDQCDFAFELRSNAPGDGSKGRGAVAEALTQSIRHLNGFVDLLAKNPSLLTESPEALVVPVVFTTARLWVAPEDLSRASLHDGRIAEPPSELHEKDWVCFRFRQTAALRHGFALRGPERRLGELVARDSIRTVFVVRADAAAPFLEWVNTGLAPVWRGAQ